MAEKTIAGLEAELRALEKQHAAERAEAAERLNAERRASMRHAGETARLRDELMVATLRAERLEGYLDRIAEDERPPQRSRPSSGTALRAMTYSHAAGRDADTAVTEAWWNRGMAAVGGH